MKLHKHTGIDMPKVSGKDIVGLILDDEVMHTINDEQIDDTKTFDEIPVLPDSTPTTDNQMTRKKYVDDNTPDFNTIPSIILIDSADNEQTINTSQTNYEKDKDITLNSFDGYVTVKFDLKDDDGAGITYGKVYVDGVAIDGTEETETSGTWTTFEQVVPANSGERVQLYTKYDSSGGGIGGACRNFRLYYSKSIQPTVGTINLN